MSSCTAEEIAEKRRVALEKLRAKKVQLSGTNAGQLHQKQHSTPNPDSPSNSVAKATEVPVSSTNLGVVSKAPTAENKASSFLNALKCSSLFAQRPQHPARDAVHPYKRQLPKATTADNTLKEKTSEQLAPASSQLQKTTTTTGNNALKEKSPKQLAPVFVNAVTCKVYMISPFRFEVRSSGFHSKLIEVFKTIPSKAYDPTTRCWNFALGDYQLLQERLVPLKPDVVIGAIPKKVLSLCVQPEKDFDRSCLASIEPSLAEKLLPFQQDGVCFAIAQHGRAMICDEMGLGKTFQALAIADFYRDDWPLLISTTASTRESWATHIRQLLPSLPLHYIQVLTNNQQYFGDVKVLITSYSMMERHVAKLLERKFGFLIFDESHSLKNSKAKCTMVADRLARQAKHVILLSGTPALSRPLELFTQLQMVDRKFMTFMEFTSRYCDGRQTNYGWDASGQSNLQELNVVLKLKFMIRRTKSEVLSELSNKYRETVILDPSLVWRSDEMKESLNFVASHFSASKGHEKEQILLKFYAQTAEVKTQAVCEYIKNVVKDEKKFIVFGHHRVMLDAISECLMKLKVEFVRIDGSTKGMARSEYIDAFQKRPACKVAVLSLGACNSGITLTAAELIIFAELTWNPSILAQAESRAHRIGQQKPITCRYLIASKTADDVIWNMLKSKQDVLNRAGIFCEDLQDAVHTATPSISKKIEHFFLPNKPKSNDKSKETVCEQSTSGNWDLNKEIESIDEFFKDVDDDAFRDLIS